MSNVVSGLEALVRTFPVFKASCKLEKRHVSCIASFLEHIIEKGKGICSAASIHHVM